MERMVNHVNDFVLGLNSLKSDAFWTLVYTKKYGVAFSLFHFGPDKYKEYQRCLQKQICYLCEKGNMDVANDPCKCKLWCRECAAWILRMGEQPRCLICYSVVEGLQLGEKVLDLKNIQFKKEDMVILDKVLGRNYKDRQELLAEYLERSQKNKCLKCNNSIVQENYPCKCRIWCDKCLELISYVVYRNEGLYLCILCSKPVIRTIKSSDSRIVNNDIQINMRTDKQEVKKKRRDKRKLEKAKEKENKKGRGQNEKEKDQIEKDEKELVLPQNLQCKN